MTSGHFSGHRWRALRNASGLRPEHIAEPARDYVAQLSGPERSVLARLSVLRWFDQGLYDYIISDPKAPTFAEVVRLPAVVRTNYSGDQLRYAVIAGLKERLAAGLRMQNGRSDFVGINRMAAEYFHREAARIDPADVGDVVEELSYLAAAAPGQAAERLSQFAFAALAAGYPEAATRAAQAAATTTTVSAGTHVEAIARLVEALANVISLASTGRAPIARLESAIEAATPESEPEKALLELARQAVDRIPDGERYTIGPPLTQQESAELAEKRADLLAEQVADFAEIAHRRRVPSLASDLTLTADEGVTSSVARAVAQMFSAAANDPAIDPQELADSLMRQLSAPTLGQGEAIQLVSAEGRDGRMLLEASPALSPDDVPRVWLVESSRSQRDCDADEPPTTAAVISGATSAIAGGHPYLSLDDLLSFARKAAFQTLGMRAARNLEIVVLLAPHLGEGVWVDIDPATGRAAATLTIAMTDSTGIRVARLGAASPYSSPVI